MTDVLDRLMAALSDRYAIDVRSDGHLHLLGQGGMASVYLAFDLKHRRKVAIKVLRPDLAATLGPDRFLREVTIVANLQHPHILPLFDSGQADGFLYFVMPFVEGQSLRGKLLAEGQLSIPDAVRILRDVADGMAHAHRQGVVHRDIKPENVMLTGRHAMVTDFGVAKAVSDATGRQQATTAGMALGTPAYMAPEQAMADPLTDHRADIYAFGVLAYELLSGRQPFVATTPQAMVAAKVSTPAKPLADVRADVPPALVRVVMKCLKTDPSARFQSAEELLGEIEALQRPNEPLRTPMGWRKLAVAGVAVSLLVGGFAYFAVARLRREHWVREWAIPEIRRQALDVSSWDGAHALASRAAEILPHDSVLNSLWSTFSAKVVLRTVPAGAKVYRTTYADTSHWALIGTTPTDSVRLVAFWRLRFEAPGYRTAQVAFVLPGLGLFPQPVLLDRIEGPNPEMVRVSGGEFAASMPGLDHLNSLALGDFLMDRYEVTNVQYRVFVVAGGYAKSEYWDHEFVRGGHRLSFEEAMAVFTDKTGRPGPSTWEAGDSPAGQGDFPVGGVSWYEAAAYAKFLGKSLPSVYHWNRAAAPKLSTWIVPRSNFNAKGAVRGGRLHGMGPYGTFDMAGNVREWCENATGDKRYILGGGWSDPPYAFNDAYAQDPFDRSPINGIRLVRYLRQEPNLALAMRPLERARRDFSQERPVTAAVFESFRRMYDYDPTPLHPRVEAQDTSAEDWIKERVSFDAAYGSERVPAYLFLPKRHRPPFQAVVVFPGTRGFHSRSSADLDGDYEGTGFFLKSGRAVIYPVYKSTFERGDDLSSDSPNETIFYRDHVLMWAKDMRRSIDYLATRADIDMSRLAYFGVSWGGYLGGLMPAVEPRFKAVVLETAGLLMQRGRPEVEPINFLPRIKIPVIMLDGKFDDIFPTETAQKPMFELLGTPAEWKRRVVYDGGHFIPGTQLITESLNWLDKYLGPVR